ncbi:MAG: hypothetical protein NZ519_05625, partial [Bacteroidia bacterium]|nr:hypothetical protein [Bacteroidia bacterium]
VSEAPKRSVVRNAPTLASARGTPKKLEKNQRIKISDKLSFLFYSPLQKHTYPKRSETKTTVYSFKLRERYTRSPR